jgi:uncharacterized membrane protein YukC
MGPEGQAKQENTYQDLLFKKYIYVGLMILLNLIICIFSYNLYMIDPGIELMYPARDQEHVKFT